MKMVSDAVGYMTKWSLLIGTQLGAIYGTFLVPLIGTIIGALLGALVGLLTGLVCGVVVGVITHRFYPLTNRVWYKRALAMSSAVFAFTTVYLSVAVLLPIFAFERVAVPSAIAACAATYISQGFATNTSA